MQDFGIAIYKEYAKMNRAVICGPVFLFNRKIRPIEQKNAPLRIALRREGIMSPGRPAAGGESRERDSFLKLGSDTDFRERHPGGFQQQLLPAVTGEYKHLPAVVAVQP